MIRSDAFPNRYLNQNNLPQPPGSTHTVIEDVRIETMSDEKKGEKPVMYFSVGTCIDTGKPLTPMVINGGNWDEFEKFYGANSDNWRGKTVELYIDPNVMYGGKRTGGIRIRISSNNSQTMTLQQALDACGLAGVTKEELVDEIKKGGGSGWNPARDTPTAKRLIEVASPSMAADQTGHQPVDDSEIPF